MKSSTSKMAEKVRVLSDVDKLALVDELLTLLDRPDPEIDRIWAVEARKRWRSYQGGRYKIMSYAEVMEKYRRT